MLKSCGILAVVFSLLLPSLAVAMTPAEIVAANKDAVVFLHVKGTDRNGVPQEAIATGFLVSNTGHVITAKHIINDEHGNQLFDQYTISGLVGTNVGFPIPMEIRAREQDADALLLQFRGNRTDYRTVTVCLGGTPPAEGDDLLTIGFPRGSDRSTIRGGLSNTTGSGGLWQTDTPFVYGYSGGPVFAMDGRVIGIVAGGTPGVAGRNFFTPIHDANYLLNRLPQPPRPCGGSAASMTRTFEFVGPYRIARNDNEIMFNLTASERDPNICNRNLQVEEVSFTAEITHESNEAFGFDQEILVFSAPLRARPAAIGSRDYADFIATREYAADRRVLQLTSRTNDGRSVGSTTSLSWSVDIPERRTNHGEIQQVNPSSIWISNECLIVQLLLWTLWGGSHYLELANINVTLTLSLD